MKRFGEAETSRRQQLESALQEAASLFKRELAAKDGELADVHAELGYAPAPAIAPAPAPAPASIMPSHLIPAMLTGSKDKKWAKNANQRLTPKHCCQELSTIFQTMRQLLLKDVLLLDVIP